MPGPGAHLIPHFGELGADAELIWILAGLGSTQSDQEILELCAVGADIRWDSVPTKNPIPSRLMPVY